MWVGENGRGAVSSKLPQLSELNSSILPEGLFSCQFPLFLLCVARLLAQVYPTVSFALPAADCYTSGWQQQQQRPPQAAPATVIGTPASFPSPPAFALQYGQQYSQQQQQYGQQYGQQQQQYSQEYNQQYGQQYNQQYGQPTPTYPQGPSGCHQGPC